MFLHGRLYCLLLILPWISASDVPKFAYKRFANGTSSSTSTRTTTTTLIATTLSTIHSSSSSSSFSSLANKKLDTSLVATTIAASSLANKKLSTSHVTTTISTSSHTSKLVTTRATTSNHASRLTTKFRTTSRMNVGQVCRSEALLSVITRTRCRVSVGTVQLHYWPTGAAALNKTFPSTKVLKKYDYTMTSPSIYYVINTMRGYELCHAERDVGTPIKNHITGFDLWQVSTLQPFGVTSGIIDSTRIGDPEQLQLSHLKSNCPRYTAGDKEQNTVGSPKCNPVLEYRPRLLDVQPAWKDCGRRHGGFFGIFDPPVPVEACLSNDCGNEGAEVLTPIPSPTPTPTPTALADQQSTTAASPLPKSTSSPGPTITPIPATTPGKSSPSSSSSPSEVKEEVKSSGAQEGVKTPAVDATPTSDSAPSLTTPSKIVAIETPKGNSPVSDPSGTAKALTESKTASDSTQTTPSGQDETASPNVTIPKPTQAPQTIATVAGQVIPISAVDSSVVVIGGQTISVGGPVATITGHQVLSLASNGVVVQVPGGFQTTIALPQVTSAAQLATIGGAILHISAIQSSIVVIGSQTLTIGGPVATLAGNQIVSLGPSGIVVQEPGEDKSKTTIAIPKVVSNEKVATVAGQVLHISAIQSSVVVIGTQTITIGGSVATITGNQVVSLGSSGIVIQVPGGGVTTVALPQLVDPTPTLSALAATGKAESSSGQISVVDEGTPSRTLITPATTTGLGQIINDMVNTSGQQGQAYSGNFILPWLGTVAFGLLCLF